MDEVTPCIRITTCLYSGPTRDFLIQHGCKLDEIGEETMRVTLPYGAIRKETLRYHAVLIYRVALPDGASFRITTKLRPHFTVFVKYHFVFSRNGTV